MYQMKSMDPLHASPTINLSDPNQSLSKNINPSLVLVQPRKTRPFITERLLMGRKESNQTKKTLIRLAKCWLSSKSKLFDILMVLDGTLSLGWHQF